MGPLFIEGLKMSENFKFSTVFHTHVTPAGERAYWVPSGEAWGEIVRLEKVISELRESHDKLIALQTQVLSDLYARRIITFSELQKTFAELQRLAIE